MKNLFLQLLKLKNTLLVIVAAALVTLQATRAAVTITSEVLFSFNSCETRYIIGVDLAKQKGFNLRKYVLHKNK